MPFELFISPVALSESIDAYDFYVTKSIGLGDRFLESLETTYKKISHLPKSYGFISKSKDLRDVKIKDFPFVVIFQIINSKLLF
jgi:hypothetical protein